jgi:hypothetical protein
VVAFNERFSKISSQNKMVEIFNKFIAFWSSLQSKTNFPENYQNEAYSISKYQKSNGKKSCLN